MKKITVENGLIYEDGVVVNFERLVRLYEEDCSIYMSCPFCEEKDFDVVGLKSHISRGDCEKYNEIDISGLKRMF